jgi:hypothetical protein
MRAQLRLREALGVTGRVNRIVPGLLVHKALSEAFQRIYDVAIFGVELREIASWLLSAKIARLSSATHAMTCKTSTRNFVFQTRF